MLKQNLTKCQIPPVALPLGARGTAALWHCRARTAALPHLQTTSNHSSKSMNENLDRRNFLTYYRYCNRTDQLYEIK